MRGRARALLPLAMVAVLGACGDDGGTDPLPDVNPLDTVAPLRTLPGAQQIGIGMAVGGTFFSAGTRGDPYRHRVAEQFNVLTPENAMKHASVHPERDRYTFERADSLVAFAERNGMAVRGHTLVWHQQLASWVESGSWTAAQADTLLREHIATVAGRYRGRLVAWDVVNEAIDDDGSLRSTFWSEHLGRAYLETAFEAARDADPQAALFYNDYGISWLNAKSDSVYAMLADFVQRGVPVHGIGFQGHFQVGWLPSYADLVANFQRFADLGLAVHVTELDVRMPTAGDVPLRLREQADDYRRVMEACLDVSACEMVVVWGLSDADSWVPQVFPGWGGATLLDWDLEPKPAYWDVHEALGG